MSIDNTIKKLSEITDLELKTMKNLSAYALPNTPANSGMKAPQVKPKFYDFALGTGTSLYTILVRVIREMNTILEVYKENFDATKQHIDTESGNPHHVTSDEVNAYNKSYINDLENRIQNSLEALGQAIESLEEWKENTSFLIGSEISQAEYTALSEEDKNSGYIYLVDDNKEYYDTNQIDAKVSDLQTNINKFSEGTSVAQTANCYVKSDGSTELIRTKFETITRLLNDLGGEGGELGSLSEDFSKLKSAWEKFINGGTIEESLDTLVEVQNALGRCIKTGGGTLEGTLTVHPTYGEIQFGDTILKHYSDSNGGYVTFHSDNITRDKIGIAVSDGQNKTLGMVTLKFPTQSGTLALKEELGDAELKNGRIENLYVEDELDVGGDAYFHTGIGLSYGDLWISPSADNRKILINGNEVPLVEDIKLYNHSINLSLASSSAFWASLNIVSRNSSLYDKKTLAEFLYNKGCKIVSKPYSATGWCQGGNLLGIFALSTNEFKASYKGNNGLESESLGYATDAGLVLTDVVNEI